MPLASVHGFDFYHSPSSCSLSISVPSTSLASTLRFLIFSVDSLYNIYLFMSMCSGELGVRGCVVLYLAVSYS